MSLLSKLSEWARPTRLAPGIIEDQQNDSARIPNVLRIPFLAEAWVIGYFPLWGLVKDYPAKTQGVGSSVRATLGLIFGGTWSLLTRVVRTTIFCVFAAAKLAVNTLLFPYNWVREGFFSATRRIYDGLSDIAVLTLNTTMRGLTHVIRIATFIPVALVRAFSRAVFGVDFMSNGVVSVANASEVASQQQETSEGVSHSVSSSYQSAATALNETQPATRGQASEEQPEPAVATQERVEALDEVPVEAPASSQPEVSETVRLSRQF